MKEIDVICQNPKIGKSIAYISRDHRVKFMKSHLIVYKIINDKIYIDRILHKKRDLENLI
ncbi:MAG: type II toxin-antitoxin system RelE/ParE family toxin [Chitinophagales bacterium]|nr:type II toxin-antitoxin system RelE/ParE family toxin [Chitinophagales bacterium]